MDTQRNANLPIESTNLHEMFGLVTRAYLDTVPIDLYHVLCVS